LQKRRIKIKIKFKTFIKSLLRGKCFSLNPPLAFHRNAARINSDLLLYSAIIVIKLLPFQRVMFAFMLTVIATIISKGLVTKHGLSLSLKIFIWLL